MLRTAINTPEVQLTNSEAVAGMQFILHTSSDVVLGELEHGDRTVESHWMVAYSQANSLGVTINKVNRLVNQYQPVGDNRVEWSSNTTSGQKLLSGHIFSPDSLRTMKVLHLR